MNINSFQKQFNKQIKEFRNLLPNDKLILSISGGLDSITMLHLINDISLFELIIVHINHKLRKESDIEENFVKNLSKKMSIPFYSKSIYPKNRKKKQSVEEWARIERYKFLDNVCQETKAKWIMTAHHANDHAETILMNISRKTGLKGLEGIPKQRGNILRPLLHFARKDIESYAISMKYKYYQDSSNFDLRIPRNYVRNRIIQNWEIQNPSIINSITKSANYFREWREGLDHLLQYLIIANLNKSENYFEIPISSFESYPKIVRLRLIQLLINLPNNQWSKHQIKMLIQFTDKKKTGYFHQMQSGWRLLYDRNFIIGQKNNTNLIKDKVSLRLNTPVFFDNYKYELRITNQKKIMSKNYDSETIDWSKLKNRELSVRMWRDGDVFQPLGMIGHQKLSDFLINSKLSRIEKEHQSVITADNKIVWVCGRRLSNAVRVTNQTKQFATLFRELVY